MFSHLSLLNCFQGLEQVIIKQTTCWFHDRGDCSSRHVACSQRFQNICSDNDAFNESLAAFFIYNTMSCAKILVQHTNTMCSLITKTSKIMFKLNCLCHLKEVEIIYIDHYNLYFITQLAIAYYNTIDKFVHTSSNS